ncbi:acetyl hydrolase [Skermanella stibiiresistens SB22]|uniref:Acetyl hydrolase n=1 Tax=Skermanella stibiiresistens SB22 TaxID=1385369 RepID=W9HAL0_9PROT|nr:alpha/beta hydrolase [Skermanella stibiiresistens]EWY41727.1 acetyl hydrolase [Skermanella stibiiresistens SB22]
MTGDIPETELTFEHIHLTEPEAARLLEGRLIRRGERVMDPKAQIVGEVIKRLRPPGALPTPEEARGQFRKMVELLDKPPPGSIEVSDLTCPGPAGPIPLRLYAPAGAGPRSLLLYFHGGGWMQGGLETHHGACGKLAAWSGSLVLAVDYRLAPEHKFPAGLEDCLAAWRWLAANAATLGADPQRLAIGGDSAGGNLAAAVCQALVGGGEPVPVAQLLIYPSLDLGWNLPSHLELADAHILPRDRVLWYTDLYLTSREQADDARVSPLRAGDLGGQPPAMIVTGGFDPLLDDGRLYADRLEAAGTPVTYREFPGQIHAFISLTRVIPQGDECLREAADWLKARIG